ncbi:MAG: GHKL domain-containing protein [Bacteroidales bacterium]|nr:GHKL domain-containing protein [Bacteroidales bacterium]
MIFKTFRNISIFYIVVIIILTAAGVYILFNTYFWLTSFWIFLINLGAIVIFLRFIKREYKKLSHFLNSIDQDDFSPPFSKSFEDLDLNNAFQKLSQVIVSLRDEAQINYQYLQTIINQVDTAIVCVDSSGKIVLSNNSSNKLFKKNVLRNINSLHISNDDLPGILKKLKTGEKKLVKFSIRGELYNYSIQLADFKVLKEDYRLFTFLNVQSELEQNELESWQKLTRVLTHEIMNSAIPISNLSGLVYQMLFDKNNQFFTEINEEQKSDIKEGLNTIESRSKGLVNFVEATRSFTKMPKPELKEISIQPVISRIISLLKSKINESGILLNVNIPEDEIKIIADQSLVEQAFLNIILNAIDALKETEKPILEIEINRNAENHIVIIIKDNGMGISIEELENIFIPFYTTKPEGSGIGLSIARQIMFLHKGNISVKSEPNEGAVFTLTF